MDQPVSAVCVLRSPDQSYPGAKIAQNIHKNQWDRRPDEAGRCPVLASPSFSDDKTIPSKSNVIARDRGKCRMASAGGHSPID